MHMAPAWKGHDPLRDEHLFDENLGQSSFRCTCLHLYLFNFLLGLTLRHVSPIHDAHSGMLPLIEKRGMQS